MTNKQEMTLTEQVKKILEDYPSIRDDDGLIAIHHFSQYFVGGYYEFMRDKIQIKISTTRRYLQKHFPELRGDKWQEHQKYSNKIKERIRQAERPEELATPADIQRILEEAGFNVETIEMETPRQNFITKLLNTKIW